MNTCTINMHLHGHLTECIRDFGPVYSFWCFAFERMNGILGNYHTNNHHISVQYMKRFLDSKDYAPHNWPKEFVDDYLPLLSHHVYNKGSLMQSSLETELKSNKYTALPPLREVALTEDQKTDVRKYLEKEFNGRAFEVLTLCQKSNTLASGEFVLGAKNSRHAKSSFVLASHTDDRVELTQINYFLKCNAKLQTSGCFSTWFACITTYLEHPCRVWFGHPLQVWTAVPSPQVRLIPICKITSRLVYTKCRRDFGSIKNDLVYVVVPLIN